MIHQMGKTLLEFEFVMGPHILQNRFFSTHWGGGGRMRKKNLRLPSALLTNPSEVEG